MTPIVPAGRERPLDLARLAYNLALPRRLRSADFDLIVGFDLDGCFIGPEAAARYVVALKGILADEASHERGLTRLRLHGLSVLERRNARHAERVLVTSEYCRTVAGAAYGIPDERIAVVPEGLDTEFWRRGPRRATDRPRSILNVARQYPRKNTRTLLRALALVRERWPDVSLRVVGGGPELPALRALARELGLDDRVRFLGELPSRHELRDEYARAEIFCMPSLQEGFGIAFLEAMAMGLPVVAAAAAAVPEVVPERAGILVNGRDPRAVAAAIIQLLGDPARRTRMGHVGREVAAGLAWPRVAKRFLASALSVPATV